MTDININLSHLHIGQQEVLDNKERFNVICCGRRWGKTILAEDLLLDEPNSSNGAIHGYPVAYFTPTYGTLTETWDRIKATIADLIQKKDESRKRIKLITGGIIEMWSLDNIDSARGRKYKRIIVDEAAYIRDLENAWNKSLRPMLVDLMGDAFFFSTPKGKSNYFYQLSKNEESFDNWKTFSQPTWKNPHIPVPEIEEAKSQLESDVFRQEFGAEFIEGNISNHFAYAFTDSHIIANIEFVKKIPLILSFDFNVDPITALACQHSRRNDDIRIINEFRLRNSDIYELCEQIKTTYPSAIYQVTGDASGKNRSALTRGNKTYFQIIKRQLRLGDRQFFLPSRNPSIANTRVLMNSILQNHPSFHIWEGCKHLIDDMRSATVDDYGKLDKTKDARKVHLLDGLRYYLWNFHKQFLDVQHYRS